MVEDLVARIEERLGPRILRQGVTCSTASRFKDNRYIKFTIFNRSIVPKRF